MPVVQGKLTKPEPLPLDTSENETYDTALKYFEDLGAIARYIIGSSVRPDPKKHILTCKTSKDTGDALHTVYEQRNKQRLDLLYSQLFNYKQETVDDIDTRVSKLHRIWQDLQDEFKSENAKLPKSMLLNRILNALPAEYLEC
ncbi:hypothetical protein AVEN_104655-1 [Araneus ventricosus]|uniref:Uncharacterized protein n=1 Tax=Araneus ventricosus TaxID=182803 RepID=A0A4Y2BDX0_ARAVE|nr:hypothetical protein AVEN_104655-1 [Araneus ventricosus]